MIGNRLQEIMNKLHLNQAQLAKAMDTSAGYISDIITNPDKKVGSEKLCSLQRNLGININWLLAGEGDILLEDLKNVVRIPFRSEIEAAAGTGCYVYNEEITEFIEIPEKIIKEINANPEQSDFIWVRGDSMEPTIYNKDKILIDRSKTLLKDSRIYVVRLEDRILVKRIQKIKGAEIVLISDNKDFYSPIPVNLNNDDVTICGQVLWMMRELI